MADAHTRTISGVGRGSEVSSTFRRLRRSGGRQRRPSIPRLAQRRDVHMQRIPRADHLTAVSQIEGQSIELEPVRDSAAAFDERFAELRPRLVAICRSLVGDDAEDAVHDTYVRGRSRVRQLRDGASLESWLTAIAVRECYSRHRRRRRLAEIVGGLRPSPPAVSDPGLRELVEALPFRDRTVVVLHYGHGLSLEEIARLLGEKPATIRSALFRARVKLRADLSDD